MILCHFTANGFCETFPVCCETFPKKPLAVKWQATVSNIYRPLFVSTSNEIFSWGYTWSFGKQIPRFWPKVKNLFECNLCESILINHWYTLIWPSTFTFGTFIFESLILDRIILILNRYNFIVKIYSLN